MTQRRGSSAGRLGSGGWCDSAGPPPRPHLRLVNARISERRGHDGASRRDDRMRAGGGVAAGGAGHGGEGTK